MWRYGPATSTFLIVAIQDCGVTVGAGGGGKNGQTLHDVRTCVTLSISVANQEVPFVIADVYADKVS